MPLGPDGDWLVSGVHGEIALLVEFARVTRPRDRDRAAAGAGACWGISKGCGRGLIRSWAATNWGQEITISTRTANDAKTRFICDFMSALLRKLGLRNPRLRGTLDGNFAHHHKTPMERRGLDCAGKKILNYCWDPGNGRHDTLEARLSQRPESNTARIELSVAHDMSG
jgi:hypothetical protein